MDSTQTGPLVSESCIGVPYKKTGGKRTTTRHFNEKTKVGESLFMLCLAVPSRHIPSALYHQLDSRGTKVNIDALLFQNGDIFHDEITPKPS
jgi:hypothetical protein